jgi:hypothetical protein
MKSNAIFIPGEVYDVIEAGKSVWFYVSNPEGYSLNIVVGQELTVTINNNACDTFNLIALEGEDKVYIKVTNTTADSLEFIADLVLNQG